MKNNIKWYDETWYNKMLNNMLKNLRELYEKKLEDIENVSFYKFNF